MKLLDNKLDTLLAVNEFRSYTTASKFLNLTQPAVSQHISQLEKEFEITIFKKGVNPLILTNEGEILVKYAKRMKNISNTLCNKIAEEKSGPRLIRVGITHSLEGNAVPEIFANIARNNPRTTIKIYSDDIKNLYDKLATYEIDLAIIEGKINSSKFSKVLLDTDHVMAVMSKDNPLANKSVITISDIQKQKLILRHSRSLTRSLFAENLERNNLSFDDFSVLIEIDNTATIKDLVSKNIGISVLPKSVCISDIKGQKIVAKPIKDMDMTTQINLIYNKNFFDEKVLTNIMEAYEKFLNR